MRETDGEQNGEGRESMNSRSGAREEDEQEVDTRERERENEPDVLANMVREPQAAQSPPHLTGSRPNLPQ